MPSINPTQEQLAARLNPTPFNVPLPKEGEVFRASGDNTASTLYKVQNGQIQSIAAPQYIANTRFAAGGKTYAAGDILGGNPQDVQWLDPSYRGLATSTISTGDVYNRQFGADAYNKLPTYNVADLQPYMDGTKKLGATNTTVTLNNTPNAIATPAQIAEQQKNPLWNNGLGADANALNSKLPGGTATNLNEYYTALGQKLPDVATRAAEFERLGLGTKSQYTGSYDQNVDLLSALQRGDHSKSTFGTGAGSSGGTVKGASDVNNTPAGVALSTALSGSDAASTLENYKVYLNSVLGTSEGKVKAAEGALASFWGTRKTSEQILQEELDRRGITAKESILTELDKTIRTQTDLLNNLPENVRKTLQDAGVSQAQLERLTLKEAKKPTELLRGLISDRGEIAESVNQALKWADSFADTRIADQAARLAALQWEVTSAKGEYKDIANDAQQIILKSIEEKKTIYDTAKSAAENGASAEVIDRILDSGSAEDAIRAAGSTLVKPKTTTATTALKNDIDEAGTMLEVGIPGKGYNGRGADGYVDPNLYLALYNDAVATYGSKGGVDFMAKYPPATFINPANIGRSDFPSVLMNKLQATQKKAAGVMIDSAAILNAFQAAGLTP